MNGRWCYVWPKDGWHKLDLHKAAADCKSLGFVGVILHSGIHVAGEVTRLHLADPFKDAGLLVAVGIGFPNPRSGNLDQIAVGIVEALKVTDQPVVLDWEGGWSGQKASAAYVVASVLRRVPDASSRCVDVPWWSPLKTPDGHDTHPSAPTREFGQLVCKRFPQCYDNEGTLGFTARQVAWSRSQYAAFGSCPILPCIQGYAHRTADRVTFLVAEPDVLVWNYVEFDDEFRAAMRAVVRLEALGFHGAGAVRAFQASVGLVADGVFGPKTTSALFASK